MAQRIVVPFDGHIIGQGFNSQAMERVGTALAPRSQGDDPVADGQQAVFRFRMITSQSSLERELNFSADLDARYGLMSGGAKFAFAKNQAVNRSSTYILASCIVTNALRFGKDFSPTPNAAPLIQAGDREQFRRAFGDRFTEALRTGGEFHALIRMTSSKSATQQKIAASLHAELNGFAAGGSFSAALSTAQSDTSASTEIEIEINQTAGQGQQLQIPGSDAASVRAHMNNFARFVKEHPSAYEAELVTYDTVALPFPPVIENEQKRDVLIDCLARKQRYWSAISEIRFAMSEVGAPMFVDLPPRAELLALEQAFTRILNELMDHTRKVSIGAIPPAFFVAQNEPPVPQFKRPATQPFAQWWERRDDLNLFIDERTIIRRVGDAAREFLLVPPSHAKPELVERAAARVEKLDLSWRSTFDPDPPLTTLESLPKIFSGPLRELRASRTRLRNLKGLEIFSRLEFLDVGGCMLEDITALSEVNGLRQLFIGGNRITSLEPLRKQLGLQLLALSGNSVQDLEPLRNLQSLEFISIASGTQQDSEDGDPPPPIVLSGSNPITDARALGNIERLSCPLTKANRMKLRRLGPDGTTQIDEGIITRMSNTSRYRYESDSGAPFQICSFGGCVRWVQLDVLGGPVVFMALYWPELQQCSIAGTHPADATAPLPGSKVAQMLSDRHRLGAVAEFFFGLSKPMSIAEITTMA